MSIMKASLALLLFALFTGVPPLPISAQETPPAAEPRQEDALRVFLDCSDFSCDMTFFRTEINFINHVRDRQDADVHVLITTQRTGAGGTEYTLNFIGLRNFRGTEDVLRYLSQPAESEDRVRRGLASTVTRGLVRYINQTPLASRLQITYAAPRQQTVPQAAAQDRWNYWTFRTGINGFFNGEQAFGSKNFSGSLAANRITEDWKITTSVNSRYSESRFDIGDRTVTNLQRNHGANALVARSLNGHLSAGVRGTATSSTFLNQALALRLAPAVEYNIFPYAESTRRQLTFQYSLGATAFDYREETIFGQTAETLMDHRLITSLSLKQPWGSINTALEGGHYLHDFSKQRGTLFTNVDLRIFRGFALQTFGNVELIRDQIHLPRRGASEEEILLRQRQLATSYRYWGSVGLSYTFGSPFANIVNPRFSGSSGGVVFTN
ncbi:MAG: hypothetical protein H0U67_15360 [Gemmatimonadetes bacterium]|nr:hypothetical protein [Gemmatimonadota bacterium]